MTQYIVIGSIEDVLWASLSSSLSVNLWTHKLVDGYQQLWVRVDCDLSSSVERMHRTETALNGGWCTRESNVFRNISFRYTWNLEFNYSKQHKLPFDFADVAVLNSTFPRCRRRSTMKRYSRTAVEILQSH